MRIDGAGFHELADHLDRAVADLVALITRDPSLWSRARPGKWTAGQHAEHVASAFELPLPAFADSRRRLEAGTLPPPPGRGPLQSLFFAAVVRPGWMPRGGAAAPPTFPSAAPDRGDVSRRLGEAPGRYRAVGAGLDAGSLDRLWIRNPFMRWSRWHYTLPEIVRMHAVHARHHAAQIAELAEHGATVAARG